MIDIVNVSKSIKKKEVLVDINLRIDEGDYILLQGHNGCGKTMLLRMIAGIISPDRGEVKVDADCRFGVIIENPTFLLGETAKYNLEYLASFNKIATKEKIDEYLDKFGLYEYKNQKVRTFSLGMKQRLALVQAMMEEPDVLLLDEPFNAIDDDNLEKIYGILNNYNQAGNTIIVATHGNYKDECNFNKNIKMNAGRCCNPIDRNMGTLCL